MLCEVLAPFERATNLSQEQSDWNNVIPIIYSLHHTLCGLKESAEGEALLVYDNKTSMSNSSEGFTFICFPEVQSWDIGSLFMVLLMVAVVCNVMLLFILLIEPKLHHPMYYFMAMLAMVDILLSNVTSTRTLLTLWTNVKTISETSCFSQMFFTTFWSAMESSIFLFMAYDRYVAICNPLHYPTIITNAFVVKACMFIIVRNTLIALPIPVMASRLDYCSSREVRHCFCENMTVEKLSCSDYSASRVYGILAFVLVGGTDLFLIIVSYALILRAVVAARSLSAASKAFRTCASHLIVISIFYILSALSMSSNQTLSGLPHSGHVIFSLLCHLLPPALNPFVYGVLTREIRRTIQRIIAKRKLYP
ncbi:olfactory receptor 56A1-like [Hyperolius riggenbachi]|uniref:olfactory receptor 56A1-like n=1 Tax=Hyperolius riggenbachi TaxID=752182 RepID=UPI0035A28807